MFSPTHFYPQVGNKKYSTVLYAYCKTHMCINLIFARMRIVNNLLFFNLIQLTLTIFGEMVQMNYLKNTESA